MTDTPKVKIGDHEFRLTQVIEALDGELIAEALDDVDVEHLARKLPTMALVEELESRPDVFRDFLAQLQWRTDVQGMDLESALRDLAAENGNEWPLRTVA